jgi:hypothetical protein
MDLDTHEQTDERVKPIIVEQYEHLESGLKVKLRDATIYLTNEDDFDLDPKDFRPDTNEHAIPKFEMARIYILVCAMTGDKLGFNPFDRNVDPVYEIYERAYQKLVKTERDRSLFLGIAKVGQECGFLSEAQLEASH